MKSKLFIPSVVTAGLLAGGLVFTGADQADTTKTYGPSVSIAAADAKAVTKKRRALMKAQSKARKSLRKAAKKGKVLICSVDVWVLLA